MTRKEFNLRLAHLGLILHSLLDSGCHPSILAQRSMGSFNQTSYEAVNISSLDTAIHIPLWRYCRVWTTK